MEDFAAVGRASMDFFDLEASGLEADESRARGRKPKDIRDAEQAARLGIGTKTLREMKMNYPGKRITKKLIKEDDQKYREGQAARDKKSDSTPKFTGLGRIRTIKQREEYNKALDAAYYDKGKTPSMADRERLAEKIADKFPRSLDAPLEAF